MGHPVASSNNCVQNHNDIDCAPQTGEQVGRWESSNISIPAVCEDAGREEVSPGEVPLHLEPLPAALNLRTFLLRPLDETQNLLEEIS